VAVAFNSEVHNHILLFDSFVGIHAYDSGAGKIFDEMGDLTGYPGSIRSKSSKVLDADSLRVQRRLELNNLQMHLQPVQEVQ
jgi:hypothetical protein